MLYDVFDISSLVSQPLFFKKLSYSKNNLTIEVGEYANGLVQYCFGSVHNGNVVSVTEHFIVVSIIYC